MMETWTGNDHERWAVQRQRNEAIRNEAIRTETRIHLQNPLKGNLAWWILLGIAAVGLFCGLVTSIATHPDMQTQQCEVGNGHVVTHGNMNRCVGSSTGDDESWRS